ncbi:MAG: bifunctional riboflavin kinase/FAD synthetase [Bacteroidales bacterium]|nr:bifunctional riboflavin kinase/FAD synthetase [Bacteroidales bacterium]
MKTLTPDNIHELHSNQLAITVGTFDGIHIGHQTILNRLHSIAREKQIPSLLYTFAQHPRNILYQGDQSVKVLTTNKEKIHLLSYLPFKPDYIHFQPFTTEFAEIPPEHFVRDILHRVFHASVIVIGHDHAFGKNREGNSETLEKICNELKIQLIRLEPVEINGLIVSSSKIRKLLTYGNIQLANRLLGYPYTIIGTVIHGDHLGSKLGFPTANIAIDLSEKLLPPNGVYAAIIKVDHQAYPAMVNIGTRPTFNGKSLRLEAHLLDINIDLYGKELIIQIYDRIREERKFSSSEELTSQLHRDKAKTLALLAKQFK